MNPATSQPPPVPCPKCGGKLAEHGVYQFKCESCGATARRKPGEAEAATLVMVKLGFLGLAFAPLVLIWIEALKLEQFVVVNAACSLVAGIGLMFRVSGWKTTVFGGLGVGAGLCFTTTLIGVFVGCLNEWP
jgi:uncharacterized protein (DUF983 family)